MNARMNAMLEFQIFDECTDDVIANARMKALLRMHGYLDFGVIHSYRRLGKKLKFDTQKDENDKKNAVESILGEQKMLAPKRISVCDDLTFKTKQFQFQKKLIKECVLRLY